MVIRHKASREEVEKFFRPHMEKLRAGGYEVCDTKPAPGGHYVSYDVFKNLDNARICDIGKKSKVARISSWTPSCSLDIDAYSKDAEKDILLLAEDWETEFGENKARIVEHY